MPARKHSPAKKAAPGAKAVAVAPQPDRSPRERMVLAAVSLLSEKGLAGASFSEVIERSGAPRGSIYHHFPGGKDDLAEEAVALVSGHVLALLGVRDGASPKQVLKRFIAAWRAVLVRSGSQGGCAIAAVANGRLEHPKLGERAAQVFVAWEQALEEALLASGLARAKASSAAPLILAAVEGALVLCRARAELGPLEAVERALLAFVAA